MGVDQEASQHWKGRAGRQASRRPRNGIGENITFDAELHAFPPAQVRFGMVTLCGRWLHTEAAPTAVGLTKDIDIFVVVVGAVDSGDGRHLASSARCV
jgi:hypothetical protein